MTKPLSRFGSAVFILGSALLVSVVVPGFANAQTQPAQAAPSAQTVKIETPSDVAAPPPDAIKSDSGLYSKVIVPGKGTVHPTLSDRVTITFSGWTPDGTMFDSSAAKDRALTFPLGALVGLDGWKEGLQLMTAGEKRRFWIPEKLTWDGKPGHPKGMLVFDIELMQITVSPAAPSDVAAPPDDAQRTGSGLYSKVIKAGTGTDHPKKDSQVTVHYSGWTTDGKMFDSSVVRGQPATFPLNQVIAGWTEGVQLMVTGEKRRLWIPEKLAYQGQDGKPKGMLVFDVELLAIDGK
jgi:FKBP-type peptidyl-prolyl cis-trans isomerase